MVNHRSSIVNGQAFENDTLPGITENTLYAKMKGGRSGQFQERRQDTMKAAAAQRRTVSYYRVLQQMASDLASSTRLKDTLAAMVKDTASAMKSSACSVLLFDPASGQLSHVVSHGLTIGTYEKASYMRTRA